jgi:hypothetical protein
MDLIHEILKNNYERLKEIKEGSWNTKRKIMDYLSSINQGF